MDDVASVNTARNASPQRGSRERMLCFPRKVRHAAVRNALNIVALIIDPYLLLPTLTISSMQSISSFNPQMDPFVVASLIGILLAIVALFASYQWTWSIYPDPVDVHGGLPWADLRDEVFNKTRSSLRQLTSCSQVLQDGYRKVCFPPLINTR